MIQLLSLTLPVVTYISLLFCSRPLRLFLWCFFFLYSYVIFFFFFFQAEDGIRDRDVTGVQTCALPIYRARRVRSDAVRDRDRLHAVPERRRHPPAEAHHEDRERRQGRDEEGHERTEDRRAARYDVSRDEHDAQRAERRDRSQRARSGLHARRRRQDGDDQRSARRVVRRLHARAPHRRLGWVRR